VACGKIADVLRSVQVCNVLHWHRGATILLENTVVLLVLTEVHFTPSEQKKKPCYLENHESL
jgi:hypothetical protein